MLLFASSVCRTKGVKLRYNRYSTVQVHDAMRRQTGKGHAKAIMRVVKLKLGQNGEVDASMGHKLPYIC